MWLVSWLGGYAVGRVDMRLVMWICGWLGGYAVG